MPIIMALEITDDVLIGFVNQEIVDYCFQGVSCNFPPSVLPLVPEKRHTKEPAHLNSKAVHNSKLIQPRKLSKEQYFYLPLRHAYYLSISHFSPIVL